MPICGVQYKKYYITEDGMTLKAIADQHLDWWNEICRSFAFYLGQINYAKRAGDLTLMRQAVFGIRNDVIPEWEQAIRNFKGSDWMRASSMPEDLKSDNRLMALEAGKSADPEAILETFEELALYPAMLAKEQQTVAVYADKTQGFWANFWNRQKAEADFAAHTRRLMDLKTEEVEYTKFLVLLAQETADTFAAQT